MRRKDREVTDKDKICEIMHQCNTVRIAMHDEPFPYIVPMNFGMEYIDGKITLYFHCVSEGKKLDLIKKNPCVSFEMDCKKKLIGGETACDYTMDFESVCGNGMATIIEDKEYALNKLMKQHTGKDDYSFNQHYIKNVTVFKIDVTSISGKIHSTVKGEN